MNVTLTTLYYMQDFVCSCVIALMWLISASVWTIGVVDVKKYTDPLELQYLKLPVCRDGGCTVTDSGNYASLHLSLVSCDCEQMTSTIYY